MPHVHHRNSASEIDELPAFDIDDGGTFSFLDITISRAEEAFGNDPVSYRIQ
jgi:hypothetical protein